MSKQKNRQKDLRAINDATVLPPDVPSIRNTAPNPGSKNTDRSDRNRQEDLPAIYDVAVVPADVSSIKVGPQLVSSQPQMPRTCPRVAEAAGAQIYAVQACQLFHLPAFCRPCQQSRDIGEHGIRQ